MAATLLPSPLTSLPEDGIITVQNKSRTKPTNFSAVGSLKTCRNLNELKQLHGQITKTGFTEAPTAMTKLISACSEMGTLESLNYAKRIFSLFMKDEERSNLLFMLNTLIRGYASAGMGEEAILLYVLMVNQGILPDNFTFPFLLSACTKISAFWEGIQVHGSLIKMGLESDIYIENSLIHFYAENCEMDSAREVFDKMTERNVVSWTSLICGCGRSGNPKEAINLFFEMVESKIEPNPVTMAGVISACSKLGDLDLAKRVSSYIGDSGIELNEVLVNTLVDMYMKCGAIETAMRLIEGCNDRNLVLYNIVISNFVREGLGKEALTVFSEMLQSGLQPDRITMTAMVSACAEIGDQVFGRQSHGYILRNGFDRWDSVSNSLIDMYMRCGDPEIACRVFDLMLNKTVVSWNTVIAGFISNGDLGSASRVFKSMPQKDLVSWNTMIGGLVQESWFEDTLELFRMMQNEGVKPDRVTMVGVASAIGYLGALDLAKWVHSFIKKNEIECDMQLNTALVDMYARCGDPESSIQIFYEMEEKDVSAWTAAIVAMAMEGNGARAVELFDDMIREGVKPDGVAFVGVLTACSHSGLVEKGRRIFRSMKDVYGLFPEIAHYGCMVDLLGRAGLLEESLDLINNMPMEPNSVIWAALLAACRTHNNIELAAFAAERVTKLAPERTGVHVLLSNVYASAGKWADVAKVRMQLKEKGVQKLPGSSSIEVDGVIHEFISSDESHPQMNDITRMLDEVNCRLKDFGHVPDLANVVLDVDEQEKEHVLSRHSEKLAMAFGLINTSNRVQIRVFKNLRICADCHSFAKLVSEIYNREIVIRDNNRFHFFRQGLCSCRDYW
ncbi:Pentatricopeptide repeat [Macleaya cordata]|uniref:Pentatricopeptide repeat n=1 Tax=Macleaya cordata TaxID=56857 RepID=A0A200QYK2_MACCD|nr:Pentatricopeptide repeat [Macleaya cordata]